jgi:hypothetical protein
MLASILWVTLGVILVESLHPTEAHELGELTQTRGQLAAP